MNFSTAVRQLKDSQATRTIRMRGYVTRSDLTAGSPAYLAAKDKVRGADTVFDLVFKCRNPDKDPTVKYLAYTEAGSYGEIKIASDVPEGYGTVTPLDAQLLTEILSDDWEVRTASEYDQANSESDAKW